MSPIILYAGVFLILGLLVAGIIVMFNLFGRDRKKEKTDYDDIQEAIEEDSKQSKTPAKRNLSQTVNYYKGATSFLKREQRTAFEILDETGRSSEKSKIFIKCAVFTAMGAFIGFLLDRNILLIIILGCGFFMIPLWRLKLYRNRYRKYLTSQLESSVMLITTSYIRNADIVEAVAENMPQVSPLVRPCFQEFLDECAINPALKNCVRNLRDKINESIFRQWCETLLRTIDNSEMREALIPIAQRYSEVRIVQEEIDVETHKAILEYIVMMAMDILAYPMVWLLNKEWFAYYSTFPGKIVIAVTFLIVLISAAKLIAISQPVEFRR